ncbi:ABC transporter ATP-binding protein [Pelobacter propionicus]|uniref:ABC transporter related protein n=1 Tax=Pelobacter propionicus (strain DSM 2379 / NBRC 103807 / OttBd1) TaxID=338966 RepID=A1AQU5_PELPD|nr:ABC transporter ATP-binding protein [Pelobacter propionicus]ABK99715.1 ABC transporter related protein [Pelobacter propionicus DSM 2379]
MSTVITVENLGKKYTLRHQSSQQPYVALRDVLTDSVKNAGRKFSSLFFRSPVPGPQSPTSEDFWALKDVSFEVKQGDRIGIIGRNGAGKSTLLKILSRIIEPTSGSVRIKGRVASLLEVGTGFHPELTGRENIFLNGAILGMHRAEIKKKFDEIVDFAEIEKFLDTPVKRYSSGMYVRLAFAVAAHLEPEILVVDEVLAVGDAQFQKKCLGKMEDVSANEGRTVLFVSHNMAAISSLCSSGVLLERGTILTQGYVEDCVKLYHTRMEEVSVATKRDSIPGRPDPSLRLEDAYLLDKNDNSVKAISLSDPLKICLRYQFKTAIRGLIVHLGVYNSVETGVLRFESSVFEELPAYGVITCQCNSIRLVPGRYKVNICFLRGSEVLEYIPNALYFDVYVSDYFGNGKLPDFRLCEVLVPHEWVVKKIDDEASRGKEVGCD